MAMHTPAPWFPVQPAKGAWTVNVADDEWAQTIATAFCNEYIPIDEPTAEANARLIAAAPDLLDALRTAESFMAGFEGDELQDGIDERLAAIRAVIAKAGAR